MQYIRRRVLFDYRVVRLTQTHARETDKPAAIASTLSTVAAAGILLLFHNETKTWGPWISGQIFAMVGIVVYQWVHHRNKANRPELDRGKLPQKSGSDPNQL